MLLRIVQARFLGAEILIRVQAGKCRLIYGLMSVSKLNLIEETCHLHAVNQGWILVLPHTNHVKLRAFGDVQRIQQSLMNVIYV